jgi:hypothetical protein
VTSLSQIEPKSLKFSVRQDSSVIKLYFLNKSRNEIAIPNYLGIARDTLQSMIVIPESIISAKEDTLRFSTYHTDALYGSIDDVKRIYGICINDQNGLIKLKMTKHEILLKKENIQIFRLPSLYQQRKFKYCKIYKDGVLLIEGKVQQTPLRQLHIGMHE